MRNLINVNYVEKPLVVHQPLFCIREFTLVRNLIYVKNVVKLFIIPQILKDIKESILVKNTMNVRNVARPLRVHHIFLIHHRIQTDEKPYECKNCPKAFRSSSALN